MHKRCAHNKKGWRDECLCVVQMQTICTERLRTTTAVVIQARWLIDVEQDGLVFLRAYIRVRDAHDCRLTLYD